MPHLKPGLVSLALHKSKPEDIVRLAVEAKLATIEWSGLAHNPLGKEPVSAELAKITADAGLEVAAYGSQHRIGDTSRMAISLDREVAAAAALGAPILRVFVGTKSSADVPPSIWRMTVESVIAAADKAAAAGLQLALEFQGNTINDTAESSVRLMQDIGRDDVKTYWQPDFSNDFTPWPQLVRAVLPYLANVHVFYWKEGQRVALEQGYREWMGAVAPLIEDHVERALLIELVESDYPENLKRDAATLRDLIRGKERSSDDF